MLTDDFETCHLKKTDYRKNIACESQTINIKQFVHVKHYCIL